MKITLPALSLAFALSGACTPEFDVGPVFPPNAFDGLGCGLSLGLGTPCVTADDPLAFAFHVPRMASDSEFSLDIVTHDSLPDYILESDDPTIVAVDSTVVEGVVLLAGEPGTTEIRALTPDGERVLDSTVITVAEPATLAIDWDATEDRQPDGALGLLGGTERMSVWFLDDNGDKLYGSRSDLVVETDGALALVPESDTEERVLAQLFGASRHARPAQVMGVEFAEPGIGGVQAQSAGLAARVELEVVESVDSVRIAIDEERLSDELPLAYILAERADTRRIHGLRGMWSATTQGITGAWNLDAGEVAVIEDGGNELASEVILVARRAGQVLITCELAGTELEFTWRAGE
jgi:hypothetical protein